MPASGHMSQRYRDYNSNSNLNFIHEVAQAVSNMDQNQTSKSGSKQSGIGRRSHSMKKTEDEVFAMTSNLRTQLKSKFVNAGYLSSRVNNQTKQQANNSHSIATAAHTNHTFDDAAVAGDSGATEDEELCQLRLPRSDLPSQAVQQAYGTCKNSASTAAGLSMAHPQKIMRHHAYLQSKSTNVSLVKRRSDQGLQSLSSFSNENCSSLESQTTISKPQHSTAHKVQCKTGRTAANNASATVNGSSNNSKIRL